MEFIAELGLFSGKVFVLALAIGILLILIAVLVTKARKNPVPQITVENLNRKYDSMAQALKNAAWDPKALKTEAKANKKKKKKEKPDPERKRLYVLDFIGDIRASHVDNLREEVTSILTLARPGRDEVVARVESPGGLAHSYGLAATQLLRFRQAGVNLTVCVDKVAASGGYMMAVTGNRILSAPFAIIGSIGVVAQIPNFHRLLKRNDVDVEILTAGKYKRTITMFGEVTEKGRQKMVEQLEDMHGLFKDFVKTNRPQLDIETVTTGEYWYGQHALDHKLVDEIMSSDDFLFRQRENASIFKVEVKASKKWSEKLAENIARLVVRTAEETWFATTHKS